MAGWALRDASGQGCGGTQDVQAVMGVSEGRAKRAQGDDELWRRKADSNQIVASWVLGTRKRELGRMSGAAQF